MRCRDGVRGGGREQAGAAHEEAGKEESGVRGASGTLLMDTHNLTNACPYPISTLTPTPDPCPSPLPYTLTAQISAKTL